VDIQAQDKPCSSAEAADAAPLH